MRNDKRLPLYIQAADLICGLSQEDRQDVQKAVEEMQSPSDRRPQAVMLRRMQLAQADPLFSFDLAGNVRSALRMACQQHSEQQVLEVRHTS